CSDDAKARANPRHDNRRPCPRPGSSWIEPDQSGRSQRQLETEPQKTDAQARQLSQRMRAVTAFGHVRNQAALEIPIAEPRNLFQKSHAQPGLKPPTHLQRA